MANILAGAKSIGQMLRTNKASNFIRGVGRSAEGSVRGALGGEGFVDNYVGRAFGSKLNGSGIYSAADRSMFRSQFNRMNRSSSRGMLIGAGVGAGAGAYSNRNNGVGGMIGGALGGAMLGGAGGYGVGGFSGALRSQLRSNGGTWGAGIRGVGSTIASTARMHGTFLTSQMSELSRTAFAAGQGAIRSSVAKGEGVMAARAARVAGA